MSDDLLMVGDCGDVVAADPYDDVSEKLFALVEESLDTYFGWMLGYSPSSDRGAGWLRPLLEAYERADREDSQA
ncbi:hypothetical protein [Gordonia sihwensis]|uniref:hypothetical protein n=1 Tax=Gordonia sihwensis TaxID=173559 RepID=UPI00241720D9|nr:hypothetical protein [Gordonia sihwensis]WFN93458.1 hypothetical protein P5P27_02470 [Gordonia sihwensis]